MSQIEIKFNEVQPFILEQNSKSVETYMLLKGILHITVDPNAPHYAKIADLSIAEKNKESRIEFSADIQILTPTNLESSIRNLIVEIPNRGQKTVLDLIDSQSYDKNILLRQGWTILWCGWQADIIKSDERLGLSPPFVHSEKVLGVTVHTLTVSQKTKIMRLNESHHQVYSANNFLKKSATLIVKTGINEPGTVIASNLWEFQSKNKTNNIYNYIAYEAGFEPGLIYQIIYQPIPCPVVGSGFVAVREGVNYIKNNGFQINDMYIPPFNYCFGIGFSQSARFLRNFLELGLNEVNGEKLFDGLLIHGAGARKGEFNHRYAQPSQFLHHSFGHLPPFDDCTVAQNIRKQYPKVIFSNTSTEYWLADASLTHEKNDTCEDLIRHYLIASTQHIIGDVIPQIITINDLHSKNLSNPIDYRPILKQLLNLLVDWVTKDIIPPQSQIPTRFNKLGVLRINVMRHFNLLPNASLLNYDLFPKTYKFTQTTHYFRKYPPQFGQFFQSHVSTIDKFYNESSGILMPYISVPVGTYTGWNYAVQKSCSHPHLLSGYGSFIPLSTNRRNDDPRPSLDELYQSKDHYIDLAADAVQLLVKNRFLSSEDNDEVLKHMERLYEYVNMS